MTVRMAAAAVAAMFTWRQACGGHGGDALLVINAKIPNRRANSCPWSESKDFKRVKDSTRGVK